MRQSTFVIATLSLAAIAALAACDRASDDTCYTLVVPGTVIYMPSLDLEIRDASGRGIALGTKVVVSRGTDSVTTTGFDTLHVRAGFMSAGTFTIRVTRPFYRDSIVRDVVVPQEKCSFTLTHVPVTLKLAPGAPPVRSLAIYGVDFLYAPGVQRQLGAWLDADPGVSSTVAWRLSDTTLARIDANGLVTAKCSLAGGTDTVMATAVADTTVKAKAPFGVARQTVCS